MIAGARSTTFDNFSAGNETARGVDTFAYDQANRQTSVGIAGVQIFQYTYDGDGKRISRAPAGQAPTASYTYDVGSGLPTLLDDSSRKYVFGLSGTYTVDKSTGAVQVYHADGLGSVRALTDTTSPTPLVVQTYRTDEFGIADRLSSIGISTQPLQYTGEQRDAESSFMYLRARMYDPSIGRFVSRDTLLQGGPTSQGFNRYAYANNRPTVLVDPSGHRVCRLNATLGGLSASTAVQIPDSIACPEAPSLPNWGELEAEFLRKLTGCEWIRPDIQWGDIDDTRDPGWLTIVDHGVPDGGHVLKTDSDIAGVEPTIPIVDDARKIAQGHASEKLAEQFPELANTQQLAELVNDAMLFGDKRDLRDGRTGYMLLYDDTVVIHDPNHPDRGTVVRPPLFDKTDTWIYFTEKLA